MADGKIIDTLSNWTINISLANDAIHTINYDFHGHYFAVVDLSYTTNITTGIVLSVGVGVAILSPQTNYTFYYDTLVTTLVTISVVPTADALAILFSILQIPNTFNYIVLKNVIKVITNFTAVTVINGGNISNGGSCTGTCYLTYSSMNDPATITTTTPSNSYSVHIEGLLTVVIINPLFTI